MKYGHEYSQILASEGFPAAWISSAISYRQLKKCIKNVQEELDGLGLDATTLQHLHSVFGVEAPGQDDSESTFVPELWVALDRESGEFLDARLTDETRRHLLRLVEENGNSKRTRDVTASSLFKNSSIEECSRSSKCQEGIQWTHIHLTTAANFFNLLDPKLAELDALQHAEEKRLETIVCGLGTAVTDLTEPTPSRRSGKYKPKSDVAVWREILALYVQHAVFFSPYEKDRGSRNFLQAKSQLGLFSKDLVAQGLVKKFKTRRSTAAFDQFVSINLDILKAMRFQELNMEAVRKILKKFDKRTALGATKMYQSHALGGPFAKSVATDMCAAISTQVVSVVPQLDDYSCPVCYNIAWRPIRLGCCNTVFCIRCMIELQKSASGCPMCRQGSVITADSGSIDRDMADYLAKYFRAEVKEKQKANERAIAVDRYGEEYVKSPCCVM